MTISGMQPFDLRETFAALFRRAKSLWIFSLTLKLTSIIAAVATVWWDEPFGLDNAVLLVVLSLCALTGEILEMASAHYKGQAEDLLRKSDMHESFGWPITRREVSEYLNGKAFESTPEQERYFESEDPETAKRALHNLDQSSWWSSQLSMKVAKLFAALMLLLVIASVWVLLFSITTLNDVDQIRRMSRTVGALLALLWSVGLLKRCYGYYKFAEASRETNKRAHKMLEEGAISEGEAIKLWHTYHLQRAAAPLIPNRIYLWNRDRLNRLWKQIKSTPTEVHNRPPKLESIGR